MCCTPRADSSCFAIGVDALRSAPRNALFVNAEARALPYELHGLATQVTINFPWGSLLGGLLDGDAELLGGLAAIAWPNPDASRHGVTLEIRLNGGALTEAGWALEAGDERVRQALEGARFHGWAVGAAGRTNAARLPDDLGQTAGFGRDHRALYLGARSCRRQNTHMN
jgi:hypothetical protein